MAKVQWLLSVAGGFSQKRPPRIAPDAIRLKTRPGGRPAGSHSGELAAVLDLGRPSRGFDVESRAGPIKDSIGFVRPSHITAQGVRRYRVGAARGPPEARFSFLGIGPNGIPR